MRQNTYPGINPKAYVCGLCFDFRKAMMYDERRLGDVFYIHSRSARMLTNTYGGNMKKLSQAAFWSGIISMPLSWAMWYFGAGLEIGWQVIGNISDPAMQAVLRAAHAERWGIFIGLWPVTLLVLSYFIGKKAQADQG